MSGITTEQMVEHFRAIIRIAKSRYFFLRKPGVFCVMSEGPCEECDAIIARLGEIDALKAVDATKEKVIIDLAKKVLALEQKLFQAEKDLKQTRTARDLFQGYCVQEKARWQKLREWAKQLYNDGPVLGEEWGEVIIKKLDELEKERP